MANFSKCNKDHFSFTNLNYNMLFSYYENKTFNIRKAFWKEHSKKMSLANLKKKTIFFSLFLGFISTITVIILNCMRQVVGEGPGGGVYISLRLVLTMLEYIPAALNQVWILSQRRILRWFNKRRGTYVSSI